MSDSHEIIFRQVVDTLPDSLTGRKRLLLALAHITSPRHPANPLITEQLQCLEALESGQVELRRKFAASESANKSGHRS